MNLHQSRILLRPRKLAETFDLALRWCSSVGGGLYLKLTAVLLLPAALGCYALRAFADFEWLHVWLIAVVVAMFLQGPLTVAASRLMFEPEVTVRGVLGHFAKRFGAYLIAWVATRLLQLLGLATMLGWPWAWAYGAFVHEAILLEGHRGVAGVRRAGGFASGQYPSILTMGLGLLAAHLLIIIAADQIGFVLLDFTLQLGRPFESLFEDGGSLTALLGFFVAVPYLVTVRFLQYIDARTRRDGWDLQASFVGVLVADQSARAKQSGQVS
ncbi:MAG: hypothetical protein KUG77_20305 [Nannocystaceae bacterium]|nr:hypothetical protein [Nannocystaceae bacterium]